MKFLFSRCENKSYTHPKRAKDINFRTEYYKVCVRGYPNLRTCSEGHFLGNNHREMFKCTVLVFFSYIYGHVWIKISKNFIANCMLYRLSRRSCRAFFSASTRQIVFWFCSHAGYMSLAFVCTSPTAIFLIALLSLFFLAKRSEHFIVNLPFPLRTSPFLTFFITRLNGVSYWFHLCAKLHVNYLSN